MLPPYKLHSPAKSQGDWPFFLECKKITVKKFAFYSSSERLIKYSCYSSRLSNYKVSLPKNFTLYEELKTWDLVWMCETSGKKFGIRRVLFSDLAHPYAAAAIHFT